MTRMRRILVVLGFAGLAPGALCAPLPAEEKYPARPIELIVPYAPGGGTDIMFRHLVKVIELHKLVPVPVAVVNKPGGSGAVGKFHMIRSKPAGYVLGGVDPTNVTQQLLGEVTWNYRTDFTYIAKLVDDVNLLIVKKESPFKTLGDLVAELKRRGPKKLSIAGTATTSQDHIASLDLDRAIGLETTYLPVKSGGEVMTTLLGGHVDAAWANPNECIGQLEAGTVRALGVADVKRLDLLPQIPTFKEQGVDMTSYLWRGFAGPPGLSPAVVDYWVDVLANVRQTTEWQKGYLGKSVLTDGWLIKEEFARLMDREVEVYREVFARLGMLKK
jgi:putative tricarboxylic transport membrane protein